MFVTDVEVPGECSRIVTDLPMGRCCLFIIITLQLCTDNTCRAQTPISVSDPRLELIDNTVHISYDILNSLVSERYAISLVITDSNNGTIIAETVYGDIGENVSGGNNKLITWDLMADSISMEAEIYIKVHAKLIPSVTAKSYSRTGLILQSLALPGLGLSRMTGKPHWIRGAAGYGCIAGSIALNRKAISTYDEYLNQRTIADAQDLYQSANNQDMTSKVLGYAAIGIWVTDIVWTIVGTSDMKTTPMYGDVTGFSVGTSFEPLTGTPLIGICYRF